MVALETCSVRSSSFGVVQATRPDITQSRIQPTLPDKFCLVKAQAH